MAPISLDQVGDDVNFNFKSIYELGEDEKSEYTDSPYINNDCNYYEPENFHKKSSEFKHSSSYFHLNCRSLSSNWEAFRDLLSNLHGNTFTFDFIGLSEVFDCSRDQRLNLPGFHNLISRTRADSTRGGVGLFLKENLNFKIRNDLSVFIPHVFESLFIEIITNSNLNNYIVGVIYRPNTQPRADIDIFTSTIYDIMDIVNKEKKSCVIMGDINIDLLKYNLHNKTNEYVDNVISRGFLPLITKPTRVFPSSATLIDHIYSNNISAQVSSGIIITDVADHFGTFLIVKKKTTNLSGSQKQKRIFSESNLSSFRELLDESDFLPVMQKTCPNESYNTFMEIYKQSFDKAFPMKYIRPNKKFIKKEAWMSAGLLESMRHKGKLFIKKLKQQTEMNISKYKSYLNLYNKTKRAMKMRYFSEILDKNKHDMKKTWETLKMALGKINDKTNFPSTFKINKELVSDKSKIADSFNNYFSNIGKSTSESVPKSKKNYLEYLHKPIMNSIFIEPVESTTILEIVKKLKPKTSFGHDEIPTKIAKESILNILEPFTHIINLSLKKGIVPDQLKTAKVIPIYKASDRDQMNNYRPVSLLPAFSKILEKVMFNKIMSFFDSQQILYKHQYGFRPKHSTIHPLIHLLNECAFAANSQPKQLTISIFCDLSKAFDVISHNILLQKLEFYGIRGVAKEWISNYLSDRNQYVEIENFKSSVCKIECGVPQGSILGPLLYLIYVNDIPKATTGNLLSFADDTSLYLSHSDVDILFQNANTEMNNLYEWFCANRLSLNATKKTNLLL